MPFGLLGAVPLFSLCLPALQASPDCVQGDKTAGQQEIAHRLGGGGWGPQRAELPTACGFSQGPSAHGSWNPCSTNMPGDGGCRQGLPGLGGGQDSNPDPELSATQTTAPGLYQSRPFSLHLRTREWAEGRLGSQTNARESLGSDST